MCIRSEPSVYVCVRCYRTTLLFLGLIKGGMFSLNFTCESSIYANRVHEAQYVYIRGLDKEQMYGGEAVTACSSLVATELGMLL